MSITSMLSKETTYIVYDGECPFCSSYVRMIKLRKAVGSVELVNARFHHPVIAFLAEKHVDLHSGMAMVQGKNISHGADCISRLAAMTEHTDGFNRLNAWIFQSSRRTKLLYPLMRAVRSLTLLVLGRKPIREGSAEVEPTQSPDCSA